MKLTEKDLENIRWYIIEHVMKEPDIMLSDERLYDTSDGMIDLPRVIASLYEVLHRVVTDEPYRYMFHHANKIGADVEDDLFDAYMHELGGG